MNYKYPAINLMKLYAESSVDEMNKFLNSCFLKQDISTLVQWRYGLQRGMSDLSKQKLNTNEIQHVFLRMQKAIEDTIKKILKQKYPNPLDIVGAKYSEEVKLAKKKRDMAFEQFLKESAF